MKYSQESSLETVYQEMLDSIYKAAKQKLICLLDQKWFFKGSVTYPDLHNINFELKYCGDEEEYFITGICGIRNGVSLSKDVYKRQVYYRTSDRPSPHNAYLDAAGIAAGIDLCGYRTSYKDGYDGFFQFASETEPETLEQGRNAAYVAPGGYFHNNPWFSYDEASGTYLRYQFGEPQIDEMTQEQLAVKNIIVQYCSWKKYDDNAEYLDIDVVNGGTGTYITSGKAIDVTWSKDDPWGVTKYRDGNGDEIKLNPGKTWVLIVPVSYTHLDVYKRQPQLQRLTRPRRRHLSQP